jgi:hypothetical protein
MSSERRDDLRRVAITLAFYLALAALLWWALPAIQRLLLLPTLFGRLARAALVLGVPVVGLVAWRYPTLGDAGRGAGREQ